MRASGGKGRAKQQRRAASLRLTRAEPADGDGIMLIYSEASGQEQSWLLEQTSLLEFFALLLRGRMRKGRRVVLEEVDVSIEPPEKAGAQPMLCLASGPLETCAMLDRKTLASLRDEIDMILKPKR